MGGGLVVEWVIVAESRLNLLFFLSEGVLEIAKTLTVETFNLKLQHY